MTGKQIAAELGLSEAAVSKNRTLGVERLTAAVHRARKTPMRPQPVAADDAQIRMLFPVAANLALQRQFDETMSVAGFELERLIGTGGHAEVWLAKKRGAAGSDRLVALKRLLPEWAASADAKRRFEKEVRTSSKLTHPNIVYYDTAVSDRGSLVLVMEYVDGRDVAQLMAERPFSRDAAVYLVEQVLAGLRHAHGRGIVHRDIKPSNILISRDGAVKVSDFGIAQAAVTHLALVRSDVTQGTPAWMSPEHATGSPVDERSDLFVVGRLLRAVLRERLDTELGAYVEKLMRPAPEDRFQSAGEALEALPECDHRRATRELAAYVRGEAIPVDEVRPSATSLAPPSTATVTSPHAVSVAQPPTSRWGTSAIALLAALLFLLPGAAGLWLVGLLWTGETRNPVVESASEEASTDPDGAFWSQQVPEDAPAQTPAPRVPKHGTKQVKRRPVERPKAHPTERPTDKVRESAVAPAVEPVAEPPTDPDPEPEPAKRRGRPPATRRRPPIPPNPFVKRPPIPPNPFVDRPPIPENPFLTD